MNQKRRTNDSVTTNDFKCDKENLLHSTCTSTSNAINDNT